MIADYLAHEITLFPRTGTSPHGVPTYGTSATHNTFFRRKHRRLTGEDGNTILSDSFFFALPEVTITEGDKVTFRSNTYEVVAVEHGDDPDEDVYQKISLRRKS